MQQDLAKQYSQRVFDRALKESVAGIATNNDRFTLENGYYVNEDETVIIESTNETGKYFTKIKNGN